MTVSEYDYTRAALRVVVAQVCQSVGWNSVNQISLSVLVDVLQQYILKLGRSTVERAELCSRTEANTWDVASAIEDVGMDLDDLAEFIQCFQIPNTRDIPKYPIESDDQLNFLKPGSREVLQRPVYIPDYMPPMYPELEEAPTTPVTTTNSSNLLGGEGSNGEGNKGGVTTPGGPGRNIKSSTPGADEGGKDDDNCVLRELGSVMMTRSGFLSPYREGKTADSRTPYIPPDPEEKKAAEKAAAKAAKAAEAKAAAAAKVEEKPSTPDIPEKILEEVIIKKEPGLEHSDSGMLHRMAIPKHEPVQRWTSSNLEDIVSFIVDRGLRESDKLPALSVLTPPKASGPSSSGSTSKSTEPKTLGRPPGSLNKNPSQKKLLKELARGEKEAKRKPKASRRLGSPHSAQRDNQIPPPQHFGAKLPKMKRIPKITDKDIKLPNQEALAAAAANLSALGQFGPGLIPGANPILPPNLYGFGNFIPGLNSLLPPGFLPHHPPPSVDDNIAASDQEEGELEEGEVSPPRAVSPPTSTPPGFIPSFPGGLPPGLSIIDITKVKKEPSINEEEREREREREKAREREREKAREMERQEREREREREREKERERERERERQEREREREKERMEREKEREREREREKEREKEKEKERREAEKLAKEKEREKSSSEKSKDKEERKEKKHKEKDKEKGDKEKGEKKKSKKEKKDKDKDKSAKKAKKEKKEKKNKKDKDKKSKGPKIFNPEDGGVPKLKIKTVPPKVEPEVPSTPKLVIKNIVKEETPAKEPSSSSSKSLPPPSSTPRGRPPKIKEEKHSHKRKREEESKSRKHRDSKRHKSRESIDDDDDDDGPSSGIITETVGSYTDESGNTIWICPACGKQDDGSPMIGCDECDDWYHWLCVGINAEPKDNQDWFCTRCIAKKGGLYKGGKKK